LIKRWSQTTDLSEHDKDAILALPFTERSADREAYLVREGERTAHCILLLSGFAYRQKLVNHGARQIISIHIPSEFVDLQNAVLDTADHNVQCLTRTQIAVISKAALTDLAAAHKNISRAIWFDTLIDSSIFREWVVNVGRRNARARIAHLFCELIARMRSINGEDHEAWDFPMTQEQIADATGLTSVHTNRTLQGLRRDGLIALQNGRLTMLNWERPAEVGDFNERYLHHTVQGPLPGRA